MKLTIGLCIAISIAPLTALAAEDFGARGTFVPKGGLSLSYQRFELSGAPTVHVTSLAVAPEIGWFVIDDLVLFANLQLSAHFVSLNDQLFLSGGGGVGIGYHFDFGGSVGLLPQIDVSVSHGRGGGSSSTGVVGRVRLPLIVTRESFFFGVGPEAHWYQPVDEPVGGGGSVVVGLFTEIGAWL